MDIIKHGFEKSVYFYWMEFGKKYNITSKADNFTKSGTVLRYIPFIIIYDRYI